ncbi:spermatogenesis-associated protein 6 isoform X2 [Synchiropus splendidus]|uniref:spermatogenesis-associated protein 6 isoform X2 n=1 Tax=Synchiropus splendidus TaxID=270530 RepID=UPI00237E799E|nr:spermatogenesis-associated protein 6 isoform X2 [Synchiropus splendidus]
MATLKKSSSSKLRQKSLKCSVCVNIVAVSCPGIILSQKSYIFLKVYMLGQCQRTPCQPPVFPLLFNQNMTFEKTFSGVVDPADVADLLEADTTTFELIQLVPPESEGEIVASMKANSRRFLYPAARLLSGDGAAERDVLMQPCSSFPGILPKVKFSTASVIEESGGRQVSASSPAGVYSPVLTRSRHGSKITSSQSQRSISSRTADWEAVPEETSEAFAVNHCMSRLSNPSPLPAPQTKEKKVHGGFGFQQPTLSSMSRTSPPDSHLKMCLLSEGNRQRISLLQLGPYGKKKERQPPSLAVGCCSRQTSPPKKNNRHVAVSSDLKDPHMVGSRFTNNGSVAARLPSPEKTAKTKNPVRRTSSSVESPNMLNHTGRSQTGPSYWEEIHSRVQRILQTHRASSQHLKSLDL